jgi:fatty acid-binding protein DegV
MNLAAAGIGTLLQIKPVVTVADGAISVLSRLRTEKRARQDLIDRIRAEAPLDRLCLLHVDNPEGLAWLKTQVADIAPEIIDEISATPTLGTHVGAQALGFVTLSKNWRLNAIGTGNAG